MSEFKEAKLIISENVARKKLLRVELSDKREIRKQIEGESPELEEEILELEQELTEINQTLKKYRLIKKKYNKVNGKITKHALVQFLNRAWGYDIKAIRREVREDRRKEGLIDNRKITDNLVIKFLVENDRINVSEIKKEMVSDELKELFAKNEFFCRTGTFVTSGGFRLVLQSGRVVTFLPRVEKRKKKKWGNRRIKKVKTRIRKMKL